MAFRTSLQTLAVLVVSTLASNATPLSDAALCTGFADRAFAYVSFEQSEKREGTLVYRSDKPLMILTSRGYRLCLRGERSFVAA